uniref:Uncharacterized protein n=1 Tax=Anguilla anguilla TaxID=7936 RepID=A0A0E9QXT9_ANGAN
MLDCFYRLIAACSLLILCHCCIISDFVLNINWQL